MRNLEHTSVAYAFSPADFFEEPFASNQKDYDIRVTTSNVEITFSQPLDPIENTLLERIDTEVHNMFIAEQIYNSRPFKLEPRRIQQTFSDGTTSTHATITGRSRIVARDQADFVAYDQDGNVVFDTRKQRLAEKSDTRAAVLRNAEKSSLVSRLLNSYKNAIEDPDNEFVHLREVGEALVKEFGHHSKVRDQLNIDWGTFSRLVNDRNIRQASHRGLTDAILCDATATELEQVRGIARKMIQNYLSLLDEQVLNSTSVEA